MKLINIETPNGLVRVQILNNDFTDQFIGMFAEMLNLFPIKYRRVSYGHCSLPDKNFIKSQAEKLITVIDELNQMGTNFPYTVDIDLMLRADGSSQDLMNKLHRAFTTAHKCQYAGAPLHWNDRFPSDFTVKSPEDEQRMLYLTDQINSLVHWTEIYMKTDRKDYNYDNLIRQLEIRLDSYINDGTRMIKDWFKHIEPEHYQYYSDSNEFDVWVGKDILGKDYLVAYYEHDDPSEWDVDHVIGYSGKLAIDSKFIRRSDVVKSADYLAWLDQHGVKYNNAMCGMPVGTIIEGRDIMDQLIDNTKLGEFSNISITIE